MTEVKYTYDSYADDVLNGKEVANQYIIQACQRYRDWFKRDDIYFDSDDVNKKIRFIHKMKHFKGSFVNHNFDLLPYQQFCIANIFGWKHKDTNYRVTRNVLLFIARKAGKSSLCAALALCCLLIDGEQGAEIDCLANNRNQANILLEQAQEYSRSLDPTGKVFKQYRSQIKVPAFKSFMQVLSSDSQGLDGFDSYVSIIDEFHAAKNWDLYNVMASSQGSRKQPLMVVCTTAGFNLSGFPLYEMTKTAKDILSGIKKDDTQFSLIYTLDEGDDWKDEKVWHKCNPSLGHTVSYEYMRNEVNKAENNAALRPGILTKNFNLWVQSMNVWIPDDTIRNSMQPVDLDDYRDELSYGGIDLSSVSDLTAITVMLPPNPNREKNPDKFIFKTNLYIPYDTMKDSPNASLYQLWASQGYVKQTSGNVVDYDYVLSDLLKWDNQLQIQDIGYDAYNATQFCINGTNEGLVMSPYSQALGNFNKPTKYFEMLLKQGKVILDMNPAVLWCFTNAELKFDFNENCKPVKAGGDQSKKIDATISIIESLGVYLDSPYGEPSVSSL